MAAVALLEVESEECWGLAHFSSLFSLGTEFMEWLSHIQNESFQLNHLNLLSPSQECPEVYLLVTVDPVKLTVNVSHHTLVTKDFSVKTRTSNPAGS